MRWFILAGLTGLLAGCNSSSSNKQETQQASEDTAGKNEEAAIAIQPLKIPATDIPSTIRVRGKIVEAWKWSDKLGENILVTSEVAPYEVKNEEGEESQTAELHAFHYARKEGDYVQVWKMSDAEKGCPLDITCSFIPGSATITDLDNNGFAETKVQYALTCRGDVSPANMKLIMYENGVKYGLRGVRWLKAEPEDRFTVTENDVNLEKLPKKKDEYEQMVLAIGRYESEKDFSNAPPVFLSFARTEWLKYVKERMGEE